MNILKRISFNNIIITSLIFLCIIVYNPIFNAEYIFYDDDSSILNNNLITQPLTITSLINIFTTFVDNQYTPLSIMSYWLEYNTLLSFNSYFSHTVNLIIHIISVIFLFYLSLEIYNNKVLAIILASIWAIHPLQVCSVAWLIGRRTLLYGSFFIASLLFYSKYINTQKNKYYIIALLAMILSGLSKTLAFSIPLIWLGLDWIKNRKFNSNIFSEKIIAFIMSIILLCTLFLSANNGINRTSNKNIQLNYKESLYSLSYYVIQTIYPHNLSAINELNYNTQKNLKHAYVYFLFVIILFSFISSKSKLASFGFLLYFIHIFPLSGLIRVGQNFLLSYHYLYIPILGILLVLIEGFRLLTIFFKNNKIVSITLFITVLTIFSIKANQFSSVYQTSEKLLLNSIEIDEYNLFARTNLISSCLINQNYDKAEFYWQKMLLLYPNYHLTYSFKALFIVLKDKKNEYENAIKLFKKAKELDPVKDLSFYSEQIADCYLKLHNWPKAEEYYSEQLKTTPNSIACHVNRAKARRMQGKYTLSNEDYKISNQLDKDNFENKFYWLINSLESLDYYQSFLIFLDIYNYIGDQQEFSQEYFKAFCILLYNIKTKQYLPYYTYINELLK